PTAKDGTSCVGRTMEFPNAIPWQIGVAASDLKGQCTLVPNGKTDDPQWFVINVATTDFSTSRSVAFTHSGGPVPLTV
ncbi:MAG: hypothetical protein ACKN9D_08800, partial [Actinomycetales bacterium]